jgi:hypothetical protein
MRQDEDGEHRTSMRPTRLQLIIALPFLISIGMAPALGEESYSYEEQEACTSDAFRLCSEFIPDVSRITACLQSKQDKLSTRCAKMFTPGRDRHLNEPGQQPSRDSSSRKTISPEQGDAE